MAKPYFIYILANSRNIVIYTGVTNDLVRRVYEHKNDFVEGFTRKYRVHKLVYYEVCENALSAIQREKQIKSWSRKKKNALIAAMNPGWEELYGKL
ncbi:MAG: GIY-YIG nuclease family protein [Candidatus Aminicenantes bacterium]|nr:GIY-YIG nuclease family protein [Candidatus Aminicenantes bacterium]